MLNSKLLDVRSSNCFWQVGKKALNLIAILLKYGWRKKFPSKVVVCGFLWVWLGHRLLCCAARTAVSLEEQKCMQTVEVFVVRERNRANMFQTVASCCLWRSFFACALHLTILYFDIKCLIAANSHNQYSETEGKMSSGFPCQVLLTRLLLTSCLWSFRGTEKDFGCSDDTCSKLSWLTGFNLAFPTDVKRADKDCAKHFWVYLQYAWTWCSWTDVCCLSW